MALFKIFKGSDSLKLTDSTATGYKTPTDGYAYYDTSTKLFYIDAAYDPASPSTISRAAINADSALKWNGLSLNKSFGYSNSDYYLPAIESGGVSGTSARYTKATTSPANNCIPKYDAYSYLISTTPTTGDNSTKVATTAFVTTAIANSGVEVIRL